MTAAAPSRTCGGSYGAPRTGPGAEGLPVRVGTGAGRLELPHQQVRDTGQFVDGEPPVEVVQRVPHGAGDQVVGRRPAHRVFRELGLAALAVCGHDHAARHPGGDIGAVVLADEVQAGVDAGHCAGGGDDRAVADLGRVFGRDHSGKLSSRRGLTR
ncbi:hypothetical protein GCM10010302_09760 [Streptomyces polychromogenes]|uniref:Uncharacterized protein n=1 Tax=Streptomyces polychromogenes TaxID=67342 RepID=A0ABP3EQI5_9ACTN